LSIKTISCTEIIRRVYDAFHRTRAKTSTARAGSLKYDIYINVFTATTAYTEQERRLVLHTLGGAHKIEQKILPYAGPKKQSVGMSREMWENGL
jgi:hypothetical protein